MKHPYGKGFSGQEKFSAKRERKRKTQQSEQEIPHSSPKKLPPPPVVVALTNSWKVVCSLGDFLGWAPGSYRPPSNSTPPRSRLPTNYLQVEVVAVISPSSVYLERLLHSRTFAHRGGSLQKPTTFVHAVVMRFSHKFSHIRVRARDIMRVSASKLLPQLCYLCFRRTGDGLAAPTGHSYSSSSPPPFIPPPIPPVMWERRGGGSGGEGDGAWMNYD